MKKNQTQITPVLQAEIKKISFPFWPWGLDEDSDVGCLLRLLFYEAQSRGLTISRWQTNLNRKYSVRIHYCAHYGKRSHSFYAQNQSVTGFTMYHREGSTSRCEAFAKISEMLEKVCQEPFDLTKRAGVRAMLCHGIQVPDEIIANYPDLLLEFGITNG